MHGKHMFMNLSYFNKRAIKLRGRERANKDEDLHRRSGKKPVSGRDAKREREKDENIKSTNKCMI